MWYFDIISRILRKENLVVVVKNQERSAPINEAKGDNNYK